MGFYGFYLVTKSPKNLLFHKNIRALTTILWIHFFVILFSIILSLDSISEFKHIARKLHFLIGPFIAVVIYSQKIDLKIFIFSVKVSLVACFIVVLIIFLTWNQDSSPFIFGISKIGGMFNTNILGDMIVSMTFMSLVRIYDENQEEAMLTVISLLSGASVLFMTGSRASWLVFVVLTLFTLFVAFRKIKSFFSKRKFIFIFGLLTFLILFSALSPYFVKKINQTYDSSAIWFQDHSKHSSSGIRLDMWLSSLKALEDMPWHGYGYRSANKEVSKYSEYFSKEISIYTHLHNEYITNTMSAGLVGLVSVLSLTLAPLFLFFKNRKSDKAKPYILMGIYLCVSYFVFSFFHIGFGEENINAFYIFFISYLLPSVLREADSNI